TFTYRAWDQVTGGAGGKVDTSTNGGGTAFSTATDTAHLTVTSVNDPPTITSGTQSASFTEDAAVANLVANPGFESSFTGTWATTGPSQVGNSRSGGASAAGSGTLTQTISTAAGVHYTLDFWLMNYTFGSNSFSIS